MQNYTKNQLYKFDTNRITNSKMADKMAAMKGYGSISVAFIFHFKCYSILHFAVCQLLCSAFLLLGEFGDFASVDVGVNCDIDLCDQLRHQGFS